MSLEPITPADAVELYIEDKRSELAQASLYAHKSRLKQFLRWCDEEDVTNLNAPSGRNKNVCNVVRSVEGVGSK